MFEAIYASCALYEPRPTTATAAKATNDLKNFFFISFNCFVFLTTLSLGRVINNFFSLCPSVITLMRTEKHDFKACKADQTLLHHTHVLALTDISSTP